MLDCGDSGVFVVGHSSESLNSVPGTAQLNFAALGIVYHRYYFCIYRQLILICAVQPHA